MEPFIPPFDFQQHVVAPWSENLALFGWIALMGFLVATACGLIGNYLILRRMALVGDAISHSVLPGIAIAFLLSESRQNWVMFLGALAAGIITTLLIEVIHQRTRVKQDSAIGIVFSTLFAIGVILISLYANQIDLDADCVLYGEISFVPLEPMVTLGGREIAPEPVVMMGGVALLIGGLILVFYKELLVSSFDPGLAASLGIRPGLVHYSLMCALSAVVVSAFQSVGAILVIAMLILPGATSYLLTHRLPTMMILSLIHSAISAVIGMHLGIWLNCSIAAAMVVTGGFLFVLAWIFSPSQGLLRRFRKQRLEEDQTSETIAASA
ncbi:MAG: metal ABC transporter permease [Verrucomicrobiaceae bacterium]|nr:MAG: metal ABC transporter permease [Verrucomicrobiaceae bacterium]